MITPRARGMIPSRFQGLGIIIATGKRKLTMIIATMAINM
jgi:hypothetical protein